MVLLHVDGFGPVWSVVLLVLNHQQPLHRSGHPRTGGINRDTRVCHVVQRDMMAERQLFPVRLFAVSFWLLRTRLVDTVATFVMGVSVRFLKLFQKRGDHISSYI